MLQLHNRGKMGKRRATNQSGKGKQVKQEESKPKKRGRKSTQERMETLLDSYVQTNTSRTRQEIRGWEKEIQIEPEDIAAEEDALDFIKDPANTRGRLSLFQQTIHTYWTMKCLLAKAMQSFPPGMQSMDVAKMEARIMDKLEDMQDQLSHIKITQYQTADRMNRLDDKVARMEKQLQQLQQVDMPGSTVKDPAPVSSSDG